MNSDSFWSSRRVAWIGTVLTFLALLITLYFGFWHKSAPALQFTEITNSRVLEIKQPLDKLRIYYGDINLTEADQSLSLLNVRIANTGNASILQSYFDRRDLPGFMLEGGKVIGSVVVEQASKDYYKNFATFEIDSTNFQYKVVVEDGGIISADPSSSKSRNARVLDDLDMLINTSHRNSISTVGTTVRLTPINIDPQDYFTVKLLVLHPKNLNVELNTVGSLAACKLLLTSEAEAIADKPDRTDRISSRNDYMVLALIALLTIVILVLAVYARQSRGYARRLERLQTQLALDRDVNTAINSALFETLVKSGEEQSIEEYTRRLKDGFQQVIQKRGDQSDEDSN